MAKELDTRLAVRQDRGEYSFRRAPIPLAPTPKMPSQESVRLRVPQIPSSAAGKSLKGWAISAVMILTLQHMNRLSPDDLRFFKREGSNIRGGFSWKYREPGEEDWMIEMLATNATVWGWARGP